MGSTEKQRYFYLDVMRVIAILLVLYTHTGELGNFIWTRLSFNNVQFWISIIGDNIRVANTSLFLMISGALLLGKEENISSIFRNKVLRMVAALFIFSAFYFVYYKMEGGV